MFQSIRTRTAEQIAADEANNAWMASRRALRPQPVPTIQGNARVPELAGGFDPKLVAARARAQAETERKQHKKLTAKAERVHRQKILTQPYESSPSMMDLLNQCVRVTPAVEC